MIIDDEPQILELTAKMVSKLGFQAIEARDGAEGLEIFRVRRNEIRCVICDLTMPRMDGWETLYALRQLSPGIPVILASGYNEATVMTGEHPEWPQAFLKKPYSFQNLREAICRAAMGETIISLVLCPNSSLRGDKRAAACLTCADLDHLVFLPSGDAALTRRSRKYSGLSAVVLKWSRARKRYERQGLFVENGLERAERECDADAAQREIRRRESALRRAELDEEYIKSFADRIRQIYPCCPSGREVIIAEHACRK